MQLQTLFKVNGNGVVMEGAGQDAAHNVLSFAPVGSVKLIGFIINKNFVSAFAPPRRTNETKSFYKFTNKIK